jgi:hypothetical protein
MSRKSSNAFTDTDFVMKTLEKPDPEEPENPADSDGFVAPEYQDSEPESPEEFNAPLYPFEPVTVFSIQSVQIPRSSRTRTLEYPIGTLKAGSNDSFLVPVGHAAPKAVAASVRTFGYRNGFKVIIREENNGIRVWRKA